MDFFCDCVSQEDTKKTFNKLAKCFHPDKGGNKDLMIELKRQYDNWSPYNNAKRHNQERPYYSGFARPNTFGFSGDESMKIGELLKKNSILKENCDYWQTRANEIYQETNRTKNTEIQKLENEIMGLKTFYPKTLWEYLAGDWRKHFEE